MEYGFKNIFFDVFSIELRSCSWYNNLNDRSFEMKKKNIILIICLIIIILAAILLIVLKLTNNNNVIGKKDDFTKLLEDTIITINNINDKINDNNLAKELSYPDLDHVECRKYIGSDQEEYINDLENNYIIAFGEYGVFKKVIGDDDKKELYVCIPKNCKMKKIETYEITSEKENEKVITFDNINYTMEKVEDTWKFITPVILCDR